MSQNYDRISSKHIYQFAWSALKEREKIRKFLSHDFRSTIGKSRAFLDILLEDLFPESGKLPSEATRSQQLIDRSLNELDQYNQSLLKHSHQILWVVETIKPQKEIHMNDAILAFTGIGPLLAEVEDFFPQIIALPMSGATLSEKNDFEFRLRKTRIVYFDEENWSKERNLALLLDKP